MAITGNSAKFEIEIEKSFSEASCWLSIANDKSFERLEWINGAKDTAIGPAPRLVQIAMPFYSIEWHRPIGAFAAGNSLWSNI